MHRLSSNPEETRFIGSEFVGNVATGTVLSLIGDLGAGKTEFVKGLAAGLGTQINYRKRPLANVFVDRDDAPVAEPDVLPGRVEMGDGIDNSYAAKNAVHLFTRYAPESS